jgi:hypothetical protein
MRKRRIILVVLFAVILSFGVSDEICHNTTSIQASTAISKAKKSYMKMYKADRKKIKKKENGKGTFYLRNESFSYAYLKVPGKKVPLFLSRVEYNYSVGGIDIYDFSKGKVKLLDGYYAQDFYYYKKYCFLECFAGGGCGTMYFCKWNGKKIKEISQKAFQENGQETCHKMAINYAKRKCKKKGLSFSWFKEVNWKH